MLGRPVCAVLAAMVVLQRANLDCRRHYREDVLGIALLRSSWKGVLCLVMYRSLCCGFDNVGGLEAQGRDYR